MHVNIRTMYKEDHVDLRMSIKRACGYMKSDRKVAAIHGVKPEYVAMIRATLPKGRPMVEHATPDGASEERQRRIQATEDNNAFMRAILRAAMHRGGLENHTPQMFRDKCVEYGVLV